MIRPEVPHLGPTMEAENKYPVGRIAGIPVVLDQSFIVLVLLFGWHYLKSGKPEMIIIGLFIAAGGIISILIHEFAHAWAGRVFGIGTTHIELNGLGGLCFFERSSPDRQQEAFISLIGPASNLALWALFYWLAHWTSSALYDYYDFSNPETTRTAVQAPIYQIGWHVRLIFSTLASINIAMFVLNMMPTFPLDGGRALASLIAERRDLATAHTAVAHLGLIVCLGLVWYGINYSSIFSFVIAYWLFLANKEMFDLHGTPPWKRWN